MSLDALPFGHKEWTMKESSKFSRLNVVGPCDRNFCWKALEEKTILVTYLNLTTSRKLFELLGKIAKISGELWILLYWRFNYIILVCLLHTEFYGSSDNFENEGNYNWWSFFGMDRSWFTYFSVLITLIRSFILSFVVRLISHSFISGFTELFKLQRLRTTSKWKYITIVIICLQTVNIKQLLQIQYRSFLWNFEMLDSFYL
jgi:hypothetical protein